MILFGPFLFPLCVLCAFARNASSRRGRDATGRWHHEVSILLAVAGSYDGGAGLFARLRAAEPVQAGDEDRTAYYVAERRQAKVIRVAEPGDVLAVIEQQAEHQAAHVGDGVLVAAGDEGEHAPPDHEDFGRLALDACRHPDAEADEPVR